MLWPPELAEMARKWIVGWAPFSASLTRGPTSAQKTKGRLPAHRPDRRRLGGKGTALPEVITNVTTNEDLYVGTPEPQSYPHHRTRLRAAGAHLRLWDLRVRSKGSTKPKEQSCRWDRPNLILRIRSFGFRRLRRLIIARSCSERPEKAAMEIAA